MLFHSWEFLFVFLPLVLGAFYLCRRLGGQWALFVLLAASLFFYGWWKVQYVPLILLSIVFNYFIGQRLGQRSSKPLLVFGVVCNLALLGYYKYAGFFIENINTALHTNIQMDGIILPLAISFFTFQQIAWLVDNARGQVKSGNSFLNYCVFVTFFPQLIAGPIVHHKEMMPQFARRLKQSFIPTQFLVGGLTIIAIGLFKKLMIADQLDIYASGIFNAASQGHAIHMVEAWVGTLAYTFQIYFDFSGYSDMAIGLALLFGVRLPVNFFSPYKSTNIIDFWRRWHMTLSRFLRDYLYIPLGGNRHGQMRRYLNLFLTMLLGGLWHGAAWTFVIWGALHGVMLMINHMFRQICGMRLPKLLGGGITFLGVMIAWIFFRADNLDTALTILHGLYAIDDLNGLGLYQNIWGDDSVLRTRFGVQPANIAVPFIFISALICFYLPNTVEFMRRIRPVTSGSLQKNALSRSVRCLIIWQPSKIWGVFVGVLLAVGLLKAIYEPSQVFLYFQF